MDFSLQLDQIQSSCRFACSLSRPTNLEQKCSFSEFFLFKRPKRRLSVSQFRCSSSDQQVLRPRPIAKPGRTEEKNPHGETETHLHGSKYNEGICGEIEKLVLCKRYSDALESFEILESKDHNEVKSGTYDALVSACIGLKSVGGVKRVFNYMLKSGFEPDLYISNRMLLMHVKCEMMKDARNLFDEMPERNLVSWNIIIGGLVDAGDYKDAFKLFLIMWKEFEDVGPRTLAMMIRASAGLELISRGKQLHACTLKMGMCDNIFLSCALIDMYSKCGSLEYARFVFDEMPEKTTVGWNSIISGYGLHGYSEEALSMYYDMQESGVKMDKFTFSIITHVCTRLASLERARQAHAVLVRHGFESDLVSTTSLVDFYCKWGRIEDAKHVFDRMPKKNIISWNALISGYGNHGRGTEAVKLFDQMISEGVVPNHVTFLAVLSSCTYSGLSDRGWEIFESMSRDYRVKPRAMHYACTIELLGREGLLDEAFALIKGAPLKPTINMWAALLTACRVHKNVVLGKFAAQKIYEMGPEKLSNYIVLLNVYNNAGMLEDAAEVVKTLQRKGLRMLPVCTWIEVKKQSYAFLSRDKSYYQTKDIYDKLDELMLEISRNGYVPQGRTLLPDVDEQEQCVQSYHSEKLAVSFGLICTSELTPLQLVQGHRICNDCHNAIKLIAMVTRREIVFRDASRFHRFRDGNCSCGDYW